MSDIQNRIFRSSTDNLWYFWEDNYLVKRGPYRSFKECEIAWYCYEMGGDKFYEFS